MLRSTPSLLALLALLSIGLPAIASAQPQLTAAPSPRDVWLTPLGALIPLDAAALGSRAGLGFNYTSLGYHDSDIGQMQLLLYAQVAMHDRVEFGMMVPLVSLIAPGHGETQADLGNLRLEAKLRIWGPSGSPLTVSYFAKATLPTYSNSLINRGRLGVRLHHGLLVGGELGGAVYGASVAPLHVLREEGSNDDFVDLGAYVGYRLHRYVAVQLTFQAMVMPGISSPASATNAPASETSTAFLLAPALRFTAAPNVHIDVSGRFALDEDGRLYTGTDLLAGGRAQLTLALDFRW